MSEKNMNKVSKTDWERIDRMTDEEIDPSEIPPLDESFFATARLIMPEERVAAKSKKGSTFQDESKEGQNVFISLPALESVFDLEAQLGIPKGFYNNLLTEDDWSFIIKLHSLLEAALSHLLVRALSAPQLYDVFARIELSNQTTGKLAFIDSLDLLDNDSKTFIQKVSDIRNVLIHDVRNVNTKLDEFLYSLDRNNYRNYFNAFTWGYSSEKEIKFKTEDNLYFYVDEVLKAWAVIAIKHSPKVAIWSGSLICLRRIYNQVEITQIEAKEREFVERIFETLNQGKEKPIKHK